MGDSLRFITSIAITINIRIIKSTIIIYVNPLVHKPLLSNSILLIEEYNGFPSLLFIESWKFGNQIGSDFVIFSGKIRKNECKDIFAAHPFPYSFIEYYISLTGTYGYNS